VLVPHNACLQVKSRGLDELPADTAAIVFVEVDPAGSGADWTERVVTFASVDLRDRVLRRVVEHRERAGPAPPLPAAYKAALRSAAPAPPAGTCGGLRTVLPLKRIPTRNLGLLLAHRCYW
jgi:hypothetical protein